MQKEKCTIFAEGMVCECIIPKLVKSRKEKLIFDHPELKMGLGYDNKERSLYLIIERQGIGIFFIELLEEYESPRSTFLQDVEVDQKILDELAEGIELDLQNNAVVFFSVQDYERFSSDMAADEKLIEEIFSTDYENLISAVQVGDPKYIHMCIENGELTIDEQIEMHDANPIKDGEYFPSSKEMEKLDDLIDNPEFLDYLKQPFISPLQSRSTYFVGGFVFYDLVTKGYPDQKLEIRQLVEMLTFSCQELCEKLNFRIREMER